MTIDDPEEAAVAGDLLGTLKSLNAGIKGLRRDVQDEVAARTRALRWVVAVGGLVVAFALTFAVVGWAQNGRLGRESDARETERVSSSVVACENGNATRQAIEDRFQSFIDVLGAVGPAPATIEAAQARQATVDQLRRDFAASLPPVLGPRNCSPEEAANPATITTESP